MIAHERAGAEAIITRGQLIDGKEVAGIYHSLIATAPETGIDSIEEMKARASDLTFAFTNPASTSGHLIPRSGLRAMGIEPEEAFDKVIFTMSHTNSAMTVMAAKVDVGGMSENTYLRLLEAGQIDEDDLVVLWKSEPIPTGPISVRSDFPEDLKTAVQEAYLAIRHERPDLWADITQASMRPDMIYLRANDSMWDGLRKMANRLDGIEMEFELSTEGREETDTSDEAISPSQVAQVEGNRS
jgi:phosphonate transport system substrate-binding protein